ncbi:MAG TPA: phospholipid carrier-dependent glycosyltransferase [Candidatus Limnocylindrales bacterium]|nr:phospholipid carrier-dependent glycosyltransferase [Candidatus Limnocylindrales bacterium]
MVSIRRFLEWVRQHKADVAALVVLLLVAGSVSAINMTGYPERFEDEGTYVSQAWAIMERGTLTHYTYWYDHPPLGWIQIAGYLAATGAVDRYDSAIIAGREFMLILHLISVILVYALARRLKISIVAAAAGTLLFALSPLAVAFSRYVLLDNVALPWVLGAFLLALSPRRSILTAVASAACMAVAILSKETFAVLLPVLLYALWRNGDSRNRRYVLTAFSVVFVMISATYILYAALKRELIPGEGHVSLIGTLLWQLFGREGTGSIFEVGSKSRGLVSYWLNLDYWLVALGIVGLIPALVRRSLRPVGFALLIGLLLLLRSGYLPYPHVIMVLPFAALCAAGFIDWAIVRPLSKMDIVHGHLGKQAALCVILAALIITSSQGIVPSWQTGLTAVNTSDDDRNSRQAVDWISTNISNDNRMVVESALWTDLQVKGYDQPNPVWLYKTETDAQVMQEIAGWQGIDYVILNGPTVRDKDFPDAFPTVNQAVKNSTLVKEFGEGKLSVLVYRVQHD